MGDESSSDVAAAELDDDDPSITAVAEEPAVTRERAPEVKPGDLLAGRYQIEAMLGKGGSGVVLRAYDRVSATVVAVKVLKPGLTHDPRWEKRFQRELRLGRPVRHPNVCRIFDIGDSEGYRFLTMEYATGGTLRDLIKRTQPLRPFPERLADATGAIAGLAAIHGAGIVHRDVKPDNMLRMDDGRLVLSDFGLATDLPDSTMVSVFVGTPHYMAPEVREGDPATTRSDVWSLGVVLHEIFFGKRPEKRSARSLSGVSKSSAASTSSTIERAMRELCARCLADDPADRPEDARAVESLFALARLKPGQLFRKRKWAAPAGAVAVALMIGVGGVTLKKRSSAVVAPTRQAELTQIEALGTPTDWSKLASTIAIIPGGVDCLSIVDGGNVRIVWGNPRRAEDIDVVSGRRRPSEILPETYGLDCPAISPVGDGMLFTSRTTAGSSEVRLSRSRDGRDAKTITPGAKPVWLRNGQEFLYDIDGSHAAVFSLPTMNFTLLPDAALDGRQMLVAKATSADTDSLALLSVDQRGRTILAIYEGRTFDRRGTFDVPPSFHVSFDVGGRLLLPQNQSARTSSLMMLDWRTRTPTQAGRFSNLEVVEAQTLARDLIVLARRRSKNVWLRTADGEKQLTTDGQNFSAAVSTAGDVLMSKRSDDGTFSLWLQKRDTKMERLTRGPDDVMPDFSPNGKAFAYVTYEDKSIMLCEVGAKCEVLRHDEMLPAWPTFSPDGEHLAYVTQMRTPRLMTVSLHDGAAREIGPAHAHCPPVWSSPTTIWGFEGAPDHYYWLERDAKTGSGTGGRIEIGRAGLEDGDCWPKVALGSPFLRRVSIKTEERSEIRRLSRDAVAE